jgi:serine/threonine protein kinase
LRPPKSDGARLHRLAKAAFCHAVVAGIAVAPGARMGSEDPPTLPRIHGYHVIDRLAVGGTAELYRAIAFDERTRAPFDAVLKCLRPELATDPRYVAMLLAEGRLTARLEHPNLARVLKRGKTAQRLYLVLEYIDGSDLRQLLRQRESGLPWRAACRVAMEVARGLAYLHAARDALGRPLQLVHRDVSLANIMITRVGQVKLLDFGIVKALARDAQTDERERTGVGEIKGKPSYMAPEQLQGDEIDQRTDQYALGVVLFELLWGHPLFPRAATLRTQLDARTCVPALASRVPDLPPWVNELVARLLAFCPANRFATCAQVARIIDRWLSPSARGELYIMQADHVFAGADTLPQYLAR